jgi:hypothetical protein
MLEHRLDEYDEAEGNIPKKEKKRDVEDRMFIPRSMGHD